jgi:hypothetical protein
MKVLLLLLLPLLLLALLQTSDASAAQQKRHSKSKAIWRRRYNAQRPEVPRLETLYQQVDYRSRAHDPLVNLWEPSTRFDAHVYASTSSASLTKFPEEGRKVQRTEYGGAPVVAVPDDGTAVLLWQQSGVCREHRRP